MSTCPCCALAVYRNVHSALLGAVFSLVGLLPEGSVPVHATVCKGVAELVEGTSKSAWHTVSLAAVAMLRTGCIKCRCIWRTEGPGGL